MAIILIAVTLLSKLLLKKLLFYIAIFLFGLLWTTSYAKMFVDKLSPLIDQEIVVKATVTSLNFLDSDAKLSSTPSQILLDIFDIDQKPLKQNIAVTVIWNEKNIPMAGQIWTLKLKTRAVHGFLNEGGFDSQRFAIANHRLLTAKLLEAELIDDHINLKQIIINRVVPFIQSLKYYDVIVALAFGDRRLLSESNRTLMLEGGIMHLMAISGMHIILVYLLCFKLVRCFTFCLPVRLNCYRLFMIMSFVVTVLYAWLTGLNPPALRAIAALAFWLYLREKNYHLTAWQKLNRIIACLLIFDPLMILSDSFWLSFYAVASLIFISQWLPLPDYMHRKKRWYLVRLIHLQISLTLLFMPIQCFIFHGVSDLSFIVNLIAIPLISLITFPAILVGLLSNLIGLNLLSQLFWLIADRSLIHLFDLLRVVESSWLSLSYQFMLICCIGWLIIIVWRTQVYKRYGLSIVIMLLIMISPFCKRQDFKWRLDMLDVGHGLAMVIHNGKEAILYDTGGKWESYSAAERVIIPFLKWHNLHVIGIIISHQHSDHIGGLSLIKQHYPDAWLMSSSTNLNNDRTCVKGQFMKWNKLLFEVIWPLNPVKNTQNKDSCVIRLSDGQFSILLTGDLERKQELSLLAIDRKLLNSTFLQVPHHGSSTSSSYAFLNHVSPKAAITSASRYNPWRLPSYKVAKRYKELNIPNHITARTGQISLIFKQQSVEVQTMRDKINPRWYHDWIGRLPIYE